MQLSPVSFYFLPNIFLNTFFNSLSQFYFLPMIPNSSFSITEPSISLLAMLSGRQDTAALVVSKYMMKNII
jgi:hypothetical protein